MTLSKKWTLTGVILLVSGFFLHPESCYSSKDVLTWLLPDNLEDGAVHIGMILGGVLAVLGNGLLHKEKK